MTSPDLHNNFQMKYEDDLAEKLDLWLEYPYRSHTFGLLAGVLESTNYKLLDADQERLTRDAWLAIFSNHVSLRTNMHQRILSGLLQNGRWAFLFKNEDSAARFIIMVVSHFEIYANRSTERDRSLWHRLRSELDLWINPADTIHTMTIRSIANAIYGDAWCSLVYDTRPSFESSSGVIIRTKPDFLPGRLSLNAAPHLELLPDLGCC
jgi:hypothetical protein